MSSTKGNGTRVAALLGAVAALAVLTTGCGPGFGRRPVKVAQRAASDPLAKEARLLEQPLALALPEDAIVRLVGPAMTCTGTVIEDDMILTAHHCVVQRGPRGEFEKTLLEPSSIKVELGGDYFAWGEVGVKFVVAPDVGEKGGGGDVAVLVLTRKLVGLSTMKPRFDKAPKVGEDVQPVGFGRCALSADAIRRKDREGGTIRAMTSETMHVEASICPGDSGGPVFAKGTRDIVGVVSTSAMDHDERTRGPSVLARIDAYRCVFERASLLAQGWPQNELPPLECAGPPAPAPTRTQK